MPRKSWLVAVRGGRRRVYHPLHTVRTRRLEYVEGAVEIALVAGARIVDRTGHGRERALVQDVVDALAGPVYGGRIAQITFMKIDALQNTREIATAAGHEVVEGPDGVAARHERMR